jgi:hypothetical protein
MRIIRGNGSTRRKPDSVPPRPLMKTRYTWRLISTLWLVLMISRHTVTCLFCSNFYPVPQDGPKLIYGLSSRNLPHHVLSVRISFIATSVTEVWMYTKRTILRYDVDIAITPPPKRSNPQARLCTSKNYPCIARNHMKGSASTDRDGTLGVVMRSLWQCIMNYFV